MIIDGRIVADSIKNKILNKIKPFEKKVCFIIFGDDPSSKQFIKMKRKFADQIGIETEVFEFPSDTTSEKGKDLIKEILLKDYSGIVIQLPLPKNFNVEEILNLIPVEKDIDVLSKKSKQLYESGKSDKVPPVARAVEEILNFYNIEIQDKKVLVMGAGRLVGEPVSTMFRLKKIKHEQVNIETSEHEVARLLAESHIVITGIGNPHFIKPEMIKEGVVLIDAGTSESQGKLVGDVSPDCYTKASFVTPVPGGVGPVTLASLFLNI